MGVGQLDSRHDFADYPLPWSGVGFKFEFAKIGKQFRVNKPEDFPADSVLQLLALLSLGSRPVLPSVGVAQ